MYYELMFDDGGFFLILEGEALEYQRKLNKLPNQDYDDECVRFTTACGNCGKHITWQKSGYTNAQCISCECAHFIKCAYCGQLNHFYQGSDCCPDKNKEKAIKWGLINEDGTPKFDLLMDMVIIHYRSNDDVKVEIIKDYYRP